MNEIRDLRRIQRLVRKKPKDKKLCCPCGSLDIELKGEPAPQYTCLGCGKVYTTLADMVVVGEVPKL